MNDCRKGNHYCGVPVAHIILRKCAGLFKFYWLQWEPLCWHSCLFFFLKKQSEDQSLAYTSCSRNVCWMTGETYLRNQPVLHNPHISQHIYDICMIVIYSQSTDSILCDLMKITMICTQERWRIVLMFFWLWKSPELCMPLVKHQSNTETCTIGSGSSTCPRLCRAQ